MKNAVYIQNSGCVNNISLVNLIIITIQQYTQIPQIHLLYLTYIAIQFFMQTTLCCFKKNNLLTSNHFSSL